MNDYDKIKKILALGFMHYLDENRPEGKACLSNGECADIEKAFNEQDWPKLMRYLSKYTESEDERIRRTLVEYFGPKVQLDFVRGIPIQKIRDWLEKQKENPKNADSIPADCVSNAKCEDRWHKVQDSLPDNGRLVLANDCLGNMLLARYDGEGNWEVSVYDNDDYYCRNTITKWCEIPSEKQKEPKQTDLPAGFYYIDLNGNRYYSKEFRYGDMKLKVGEQKPVLTAKEAWKEMRLEVYAQASGNRHEPNYSDDSTKMFSLCDIDEIFEKIGNSTVEQKPAWSEEDEKMLTGIIERGSVQVPPYTTALREEQIEWLVDVRTFHRLRPKQERSEYERILKGIIGKIDHDQTYGVSKDDMLNFLNKL